jgi:uncharacterized protein YggE
MIILLFLSSLFASTVTVKGTCIKAVVPDRASVEFQVITKDPKNPQVAVKETINRMQKLTAKMKGLNLPDGELMTTSFQVNEINEWDGQKQVFKGYQSSQSLKVISSNFEKISESMSLASSLGVNSIHNFSTFLSPALYQAEYKKCLQSSVGMAQEKATLIAESLNKQIKDLVLTLESGSRAPETSMVRNAKMSESSVESFSSSPDIQAGSILINAEVESTYNLK